MPFPISLNQEDYEALVELARQGTVGSDGAVVATKALALDAFLRSIETKSGIVRSVLWVQWQEQDEPLPPGTNFPTKWPPEKRFYLALVTRPIARADVDAVIKAKAKQPVNVLVTKDPAAIVGWTELDAFFR